MEGNKNFIQKRNRDNSKNMSRDFKRGLARSKDFSQKKNGFGVKFQRNNQYVRNPKYDHVDYYEEGGFNDDHQVSKKKYDIIKIAKFWEQKQIIEPVNTQGKIIFSEKDKYLFSIVGNQLKVFDMFNLNLIKTFEQLNKANGKIIIFDKSFKFVAIATTLHNILVYDCSNFNLTCNFEGHSNFIYDLTFNPDVEKYILYSCSEDGTVKIWDIVLNKLTGTLSKHEKGVRTIQLTNDGKSIISVSVDNQIILWKLQNFQIIKAYNLEMVPPIESMFYFTRKTLFNNEKELIPTLLVGCEDGTLLEINLKKSDINDLSIRQSFLNQPICQINYFSDLNKMILLTVDQCLIYLDINLVNENITKSIATKIIPGYCQEVLDIRILKLDSLNEVEKIQKIEIKEALNNEINQQDELKVLQDDDEIEIKDKNKIYNNLEYIFSSNDSTLKYFFNNKIKLFEGHTDFIMNIDIKNEFISTSSKDNTVRLWKYYYDITETGKEFVCKCFALLKGHSEVVNSSALILKKTHQLVSASKDKSLKIWDFSSLISEDDKFLNITEPFVISESIHSEITHDEEINMVRISPNEKLIASCSYDKSIKIFNRKLEELSCLKGHRRAVIDISFSKYAKLLASASTDKTIKIWNLSDYTCLNTFEGHLSGVLKISWLYFGTHLLSAGSDGLIKFWNLKNSECINTLNAHEGKIWALDINNQDEKNPLIVSGATDSKIVQWKDVTEEKQEKEIQELEDKMMKEEQLRHLTLNNELYKALKLSLDLSRKNDFITILKKIINKKLQETDNDISILNMDQIQIVINNRKKLDELSDESNILSLHENPDPKTKNYFENLKKLILDKELIKIIMNPTRFLIVLEIIRDNNVKTSNFLIVQILLKMILVRKNYEEYSNKNNNTKIGIKNKGFKKIKKKVQEIVNIDYFENFEIIKAYSEKHYERINREITKAYLLDFVMDKLKMV